MKPHSLILASCLFLLSSAFRVSAATSGGTLDLRVPMAPTLVNVGGEMQLVYELVLSNASPDTLEIGRVRVIDATSNAAIADMAGSALDAVFAGAPRKGSPTRLLAPGAAARVYFNVVPDPARPAPRALRHRVDFYRARPGAAHIATVADGGAIAVAADTPAVLAPPVRGGPWAAIYDPSAARGHRRVVIEVDSRARIPARFAIDWIKLDADGRYAHGDAARVANWYGYAADVLAVADGVVAATRSDRPESESTTAPQKNALENASGNYVVLAIGHGRFAIYEHLQPGSVRVKPGERVRVGDVIGALGYTGDSTGPHLHLHVADTADPLAAEGLPYVLDHYEMLGSYPAMDAFGTPWQPVRGAAPSARRAELPAPNSVIVFPDAKPTPARERRD